MHATFVFALLYKANYSFYLKPGGLLPPNPGGETDGGRTGGRGIGLGGGGGIGRTKGR